MLLPSMSDSDCVAKTTEAFFLRSVFSHSRSCCGESGVVEDQPALVDDEQGRPAVEAALDAMEQIGQHGRRGAGADQAFGLERLHVRLAQPLGFGVQQPAVRVRRRNRAATPASAPSTATGPPVDFRFELTRDFHREVMEWMPPPAGIVMCQSDVRRNVTQRREHP